MKSLRTIANLGMLCACALLLVAVRGSAQPGEGSKPFYAWAQTPPMGWNSWDCYGCTVTEAQTKANADYMADKLARHGWQYIVVDIQWYTDSTPGFNYAKNPRITLDEYGRLLPVPTKFPSAAGGQGFKPLADYVHAKGLKFGVHLLRGIPRKAVELNTPILGSQSRAAEIANKTDICKWNPDMYGVDMSKPGAQEYYNSIFKLFAEWGIDYVKVDDLSAPLYHKAEIEGLRQAIDACGRPMVLSTSPGETPLTEGAHVAANANLWRISNDFWDDWPALYSQFERLNKWTPFRAPGHWPDADMLPLGNVRAIEKKGWTHFTQDEQVTLMTLWSIARSPLMFGGNMPKNDAFTDSLITNDEVLAVNQHSSGNRQLFRNGTTAAWVADAPEGKGRYLALFNVGPLPERRRGKKVVNGGKENKEKIAVVEESANKPQPVTVKLADLGFKGACTVRDLWSHKDLGTMTGEFAPKIPLHGAGLYLVKE